ncbi:MAG: hypothetical protein PHO03_03525 [Candidatus Omnitrophica bacterium]|nr:hypothetical protein [Candidatus Omnitrophota bacterium]
MEKKEFPNKGVEPKIKPGLKGAGPNSPAKPNWISNKVFDIIKLILGICLLPFVYSFSVAFLSQIAYIDVSLQNYFWVGVITLVLVYLFIWEPAVVYERGHRLVEIIFSFFQPLVKFAPYLLPVYTIVLFILYLFLSIFIQDKWLIEWAMFFFGLSIALHLVFAAQSIRSKKGDLLKSNYIFGFSFMYIISLGLVALFLNFIFKEFSFVNFSNSAYSIASSIFNAVFSQLFMVKP